MGEDTRGNQTNGWDDKKKTNKCIINIFCDDKKHCGMDDDKTDDGHCIINIFCNDKNNDDKDW